MPDWAVSRSPYSFPFPLKQKFDLDEKGYPLIEQCTKTKFALFYFAFDITQTFQALFENTDGVADSFASFWGEVAKYFKDEPNVLGYEILNEPISGNVYHNLLEFLWPHKGNNKNLLPLYQRVNNQIRKHDQEKIIFFEPGISDQLGAGFADTPGGISYRDREVYSYHLYCPLVDNFGIPTNDIGCKVFDKIFFGMREKVAKQLSVGKFLTEFGAMTDHPTGYH
jgi:endoglycosylceramidase